MPVDADSVTLRTAAAATAASAALPPRRRIASPACDASGLLVATMPRRATTIERRVLKSNDIGFMQNSPDDMDNDGVEGAALAPQGALNY